MNISVKEFTAIFNDHQIMLKYMQGQIDIRDKELDQRNQEIFELKDHNEKQYKGMTKKMNEYQEENKKLKNDNNEQFLKMMSELVIYKSRIIEMNGKIFELTNEIYVYKND